jgi:hypothetical protein
MILPIRAAADSLPGGACCAAVGAIHSKSEISDAAEKTWRSMVIP